MSANMNQHTDHNTQRLRLTTWAGAVCLFLLPLVAMQFSDEVNWDIADFAVFGVMLVGAGIAHELTLRKPGNSPYRIAVGIALVAAFLLSWLSLGVGIVGRDADPANLMYFAVIAVGVISSIVARLKAQGMVYAMYATAITQVVVAAIAMIAGLGSALSNAWTFLALNGIFLGLFIVSARLFKTSTK